MIVLIMSEIKLSISFDFSRPIAKLLAAALG